MLTWLLLQLNPTVKKTLSLAEEGTGRLLDVTKDVLGGIAMVASRGISWHVPSRLWPKAADTSGRDPWRKMW
jgi:hypothetical protein